MCTNYVSIKSQRREQLAQRLHVDVAEFLDSPDIRPGATISIVTGGLEQRVVRAATWWLYLQQTEAGLKPHKNYFSVNTNHAKLPSKVEYRKSRCIIPATAFIESQDGKAPHLLQATDGSAIAFGGLYKQWTDRSTGEVIYSASIITLPGHPALENIHRKSTPLWLPEAAFDAWLSPQQTNTAMFDDLLTPALQSDLSATPIDKVGNKIPIGEPFTVSAHATA
jgi:putative SOS response-associated peptidase YedK